MIRTLASSLRQQIPGGQLGRYLVVGIGNTLFGYSTFALLNLLLEGRVPMAYMVASLAASVINITVAFFGYKWFVFKTKGNYLTEWARCLVVYSGTIGLGLVLLPLAVLLIERLVENPRIAPYIAGALVMGVQVVGSFIGHRRYSFGVGAERRGSGP